MAVQNENLARWTIESVLQILSDAKGVEMVLGKVASCAGIALLLSMFIIDHNNVVQCFQLIQANVKLKNNVQWVSS